jgi:ribosomal protein S18 acetylase RimI-like enzyme
MNLTVGSIDDKVVAFANLYDVQPGKWAFIGNVVVQEAQRGRGAGRALVDHMLGLIFVEHALPEARISVFSENTSALRLYETMGFAEYGRESRKDPRDREVTLLHLKRGQTE